jgi:hypothetical protein
MSNEFIAEGFCLLQTHWGEQIAKQKDIRQELQSILSEAVFNEEAVVRLQRTRSLLDSLEVYPNELRELRDAVDRIGSVVQQGQQLAWSCHGLASVLHALEQRLDEVYFEYSWRDTQNSMVVHELLTVLLPRMRWVASEARSTLTSCRPDGRFARPPGRRLTDDAVYEGQWQNLRRVLADANTWTRAAGQRRPAVRQPTRRHDDPTVNAPDDALDRLPHALEAAAEILQHTGQQLAERRQTENHRRKYAPPSVIDASDDFRAAFVAVSAETQENDFSLDRIRAFYREHGQEALTAASHLSENMESIAVTAARRVDAVVAAARRLCDAAEIELTNLRPMIAACADAQHAMSVLLQAEGELVATANASVVPMKAMVGRANARRLLAAEDDAAVPSISGLVAILPFDAAGQCVPVRIALDCDFDTFNHGRIDQIKATMQRVSQCSHIEVISVTRGSTIITLHLSGVELAGIHEIVKNADFIAADLKHIVIGSATIETGVEELDPTFNRTYGKGHTHWSGKVPGDNYKRGEKYPSHNHVYICPNGWTRCGLRVEGFDALCSADYGWPVCYHGTASTLAAQILSTGLRGTPNLCHAVKPGASYVYLTPCIEYAAHPRYSKPLKLKDGRYLQMILQCRVNPAKIDKIGSETLSCHGKPIETDPASKHKIGNDGMEWLVEATELLNHDGHRYVTYGDVFVVYGIMVRVAENPGDLPSSSWWPYCGQSWQHFVVK